MPEIRAIIADDEEQLRSYLKSGLSTVWPELVICGEAGNGKEALNLTEKHRPDIAFLDIKMPGLSGMDVASKIAGTCWIVFITAYDQYAVEAFENEAIDYLLKPVTDKRLQITVKRLQKQIADTHKPPSELASTMERVLSALEAKETPGYLRWIKVLQREEIRLIPVDEVYYFQASDKYTLVMTRNGESLIKKSIKELSAELNPDQFWRIHRGTIVNANQIAKVNRFLTGRLVIKLKDLPETLTISRTYTHLFRQM